MARKKEGPPDGTRRTLKLCASKDTLYNANEGNSPRRQVQPLPIGSPAAQTVADLNFRRNVEQMHSLGARVTAEVLAELGAEQAAQTTLCVPIHQSLSEGDTHRIVDSIREFGKRL